MDVAITSALAVVAALLASSGFWAYIQSKTNVKTATDRLIMGLAYDKIITLGMNFIERGWLTKDEYEDFRKYLYEPYLELGGNGVAERIMLEVSSLPLKMHSKHIDIIRAKSAHRESREYENDEPDTGPHTRIRGQHPTE